MKNKILFALLSLCFVLTGCSEKFHLSEIPFTIEFRSIQAKTVLVDIFPENNDFGYCCSVIPVKQYNALYGNDASLVEAKYKEDMLEWEKYYKDVASFRNATLYIGAYFLRKTNLEPETDYYFYAFPYDENDKPIPTVVKKKFTTTAYRPSEIDFDVTLDGSVISVVPSDDNEKYYYDYELVETVDSDFIGSPALFYYLLVLEYEEYGFMSGLLSKGSEKSDIADYYNLKSGQELYMVCTGYDNGVNSPYHIFKLEYAGSSLPGKVTRVEDPVITVDDFIKLF